MSFQFLHSSPGGLVGGAISGAILAGIHAAGGLGSGAGVVLGAVTGSLAGLLIAGAASGILYASGVCGSRRWSTAQWRRAGYLIGAVAVAIIHGLDRIL
jgi:hypothetical protein